MIRANTRTKTHAALTAVLAAALAAGAGACTNPLDLGASKQGASRLGGVDDRGRDLCRLHGWYDDGECDEFCPEADPDCSTSSQCPPVRCAPGCTTVQGSDGCSTCRCDTCEGPDCPVSSCEEKAPCTIDCQYGYVTDSDGCEVCECLPAPDCTGLDQATCTATLGCEAFCGLTPDDSGFVGCFSPESPPPPSVGPCATGYTVGSSCPGTPSDDFALQGVKGERDVLLLGVGYGGGCRQHVFTFCWDGSFAESFPVQARINIHHEANDDACDAYISEVLRVDVSPLKRAYQEAYQTESGEIFLHIGNTGESILYEF